MSIPPEMHRCMFPIFVAFLFCVLTVESVQAQLSIAAQCQRACEQQNPDVASSDYQQCLKLHCEDVFNSMDPEPTQSNSAPLPPTASVSNSGSWSTVGFEERSAVVPAAQGQTTLNYSCDGRGGHFIGLGGVERGDRVIGMLFDNGSQHYPTISGQPTGFQIKLWKNHPLIQAIKAGSAVRLFERDGRVIGDYSLRNSSRAIGVAEANCGN